MTVKIYSSDELLESFIIRRSWYVQYLLDIPLTWFNVIIVKVKCITQNVTGRSNEEFSLFEFDLQFSVCESF